MRFEGLAAAQPLRGACVAMGNFDGMHRGHMAVLAVARHRAATLGVPFAVLTFEPHPRSLFQPDAAPFRLSDAEERARAAQAAGAAGVIEIPFTREFAALTAEAFIQQVLVDGLAVRAVAVGEDFCFGKGRTGDVHLLRQAGAARGFIVDAVAATGQPRFSSTAIRQALSAGRPRMAAWHLGRWFHLNGVVERGDQRGRELGFPTANLPLSGFAPAFGIYAVSAEVLDGPHRGEYHGAASLGLRPTFDKTIPNVETHLFDFKGDLYGARLRVALRHYLRPEVKFTSLPALIAQMGQDCEQARALLRADDPPWGRATPPTEG